MSDLFDVPDLHDPGGKVRHKIPSHWVVGAQFGGAGACYRYSLMHRWGKGPMAVAMLMNPSTADYRCLDPTVKRTAAIFARLGYAGQYIVNVCGYRATNKLDMLKVKDPVGPNNLSTISIIAEKAAIIVVGHGILPPGLQGHADAAVNFLRANGHALHVLKLTKGGIPQHPLYIPAGVTPIEWADPQGGKS